MEEFDVIYFVKVQIMLEEYYIGDLLVLMVEVVDVVFKIEVEVILIVLFVLGRLVVLSFKEWIVFCLIEREVLSYDVWR